MNQANTTTRKNDTMITVNTRTDDLSRAVEYPNATKWHTDEHGALHVIEDGKGNVGTHACGTWAYVKHEPPMTRNVVGDLEELPFAMVDRPAELKLADAGFSDGQVEALRDTLRSAFHEVHKAATLEQSANMPA